MLHYTGGLYNYILIHSCFWPDKRILSISFCLIHTIINQTCLSSSPPLPLLWVLGSAVDGLGVPRGGWGSPEGVRNVMDWSQMLQKCKCKSLCKVLYFPDKILRDNTEICSDIIFLDFKNKRFFILALWILYQEFEQYSLATSVSESQWDKYTVSVSNHCLQLTVMEATGNLDNECMPLAWLCLCLCVCLRTWLWIE